MTKHLRRFALIALLCTSVLGVTAHAQSEAEKEATVIYKYTPATVDLPWIPEGYETVDWAAYAKTYRENILSDPAHFYEAPGLYHTEEDRFGIVSNVGDAPTKENVEAMTLITLLLSDGELPKSEVMELATKIEGYYSLDQGENVFLNYMDAKSRDLHFYEQIYPGLLYFMLMDKLEPTENSDRLLEQIADGWYEVVMNLGGKDRIVDFAYAGYDFTAKQPFHEDHHLEIDAAAGIAMIEYYAFQKFQDRKYIRAAQYCMNYLDDYKSHYGTTLLYFYAPYLAARLNYEEAFKYDIAWHMGLAFEPTKDNWGWLDTGLIGSRTEYGGTSYTYESVMGLTALIPTVKYDPRYANEIGRAILYGSHGLSQQSNLWRHPRDIDEEIESLKAQSSIGYLASMIEPTNVDGILKTDLNRGDFYQDHLENPCFLLFNPFAEKATVDYEIATEGMVGLFDLVTQEFLHLNVQGAIDLELNGESSAVIIEIPLEAGDNQYKIDRKVEKQAPTGKDASIRFLNLKENEVVSQDFEIELEMLFRETSLETLAIYVDDEEVYKNVSFEDPFYLELEDIAAGYHLLKATMTTKSGTEDSAYIQIFVEKPGKDRYYAVSADELADWKETSPVMEVDFSQSPVLELRLSQYISPWTMELIDVASGVSYVLKEDSVEAGQLNINLEETVEGGAIRLYGTHEVQLRYTENLPLEEVRIYSEGVSPLPEKQWATSFTPQKMVNWPAGKSGQLNYRDGLAILTNGVSKTDWFQIKLDKNPRLKLQVKETGGTWAVLAYLEGEDGPKYLQYPTDQVGTFTYDLSGIWDVMHNEPHAVQFWIASYGEEDAPTYLDHLNLAYRPGFIRLASAGAIVVLTLIAMFVEMRRES